MIRGWCPTVHAPMPSGDGLLARVKPFGGRLPAAALHALAEAVGAYANGVVELTGRGNLQIRGVHDPVAFARATVAAGLADAHPVREARRNVTTVPPCDDSLVAEVEAVLAETPGLSAKFGVTVIGNRVHVGEHVLPDAEALRVYLPSCQDSTLASTARIGSTEPPPGDVTHTAPWMPGSRPGMTGNLVHLPFGQTDAATLAWLAERTPELRTTPWRAFFSAVPVPGFETPGSIAACPGGPACASGSVPARADAALLRSAGFADLHVSGCAKGCAYPGAITTLVGRDGRYDLVRHGRAGDRPDRTGLTLTEVMAAL